ncbi:unnamed protein product [Zymoseptoria tritici ST99CH_1A5]|uniref:Uncharacterized protein n=1 Tax=Zymoseptoria tritici ST99CH_1A5 TaxID=1276529 RepID=A0A1Y6LWK2_ZYMTR|nr:unnamed protein product [Zymoseptoria tritici ST99CH_1A5]
MQEEFDIMPTNGWSTAPVNVSGVHPTYDQTHLQAPYPNYGGFDYNSAADGVSYHDQTGTGLFNHNGDHSGFTNPFPSTPPATSRKLKVDHGTAEHVADDDYTPSRKPTQSLPRSTPAAPTGVPAFDNFYSAYPSQHLQAPYATSNRAPLPTIKEDDEDSQAIWTNRFQTAEEAANYLSTLQEPLQLPVLTGDDAVFYQAFFMHEVAEAAFKAITHSYGPPPKGWDEIKRCYYAKQQDNVMEKIVEILHTPQGRKTAEARVFMAVQAGIDAHLVGMPASHFGKRKRGAGRVGYKSDVSLICSQRLEAMRVGIEQNKLIAFDVLNGVGLTDFARNPGLYLERKYINVKSNGNKKEGQQLFNKMKKESVAEPAVQYDQFAGTEWSVPPSPDSGPTKQQHRAVYPEDEVADGPSVNNMYGQLSIHERGEVGSNKQDHGGAAAFCYSLEIAGTNKAGREDDYAGQRVSQD